MTQVKKFWPILTGTHKYEKTLSTRNKGHGVFIQAPILAYLIETANGRILYDVGCDYEKINDPLKRKLYYENEAFPFGPPEMSEEQKLENKLAHLGLLPNDVDVVFVGHLHFDHGGGLKDMPHADIHVHQAEMKAAQEPADDAYFADDFCGDYHWSYQSGEYDLAPGVRAIESPGHTAGHMSMIIELPKGPPIILAGDAADLQENITEEIAPGLCWNNNEAMAIESIKKLKNIAKQTGAQLWPNHDIEFYRQCHPFPMYYE